MLTALCLLLAIQWSWVIPRWGFGCCVKTIANFLLNAPAILHFGNVKWLPVLLGHAIPAIGCLTLSEKSALPYAVPLCVVRMYAREDECEAAVDVDRKKPASLRYSHVDPLPVEEFIHASKRTA